MRFYHPLLNFLDENPVNTARMLANAHLKSNIENACQILLMSNFYMVGIRSKRAAKHYFGKENKTESLQRFFPDWPFSQAPKFSKYNAPETKWCRQCKNHYDVILAHLEACFDEWAFRTGREHDMIDMLEFLRSTPYSNSLRFGIKVVYIENLKVVLPWKQLPPKFRKRDLILANRLYYRSIVRDPFAEYMGSKRDIPDFVLEGRAELDQSPHMA